MWRKSFEAALHQEYTPRMFPLPLVCSSWLCLHFPLDISRQGRCSGGASSWQWTAGGAIEKKDRRCPWHGRCLHTDCIRSAQNCKLCFSTAGYYPLSILFSVPSFVLVTHPFFLLPPSNLCYPHLPHPRLKMLAPFLSRGDDLLWSPFTTSRGTVSLCNAGSLHAGIKVFLQSSTNHKGSCSFQ